MKTITKIKISEKIKIKARERAKVNVRKRKTLIGLMAVCCMLFAYGQTQGQTPVSKVKNAITTTVLTQPVTSVSQINENNSLTSIQYSDGLGRANMSVAKKITPTGKDLVSMTSYDAEGMVAESWLPVPVTPSALPPAYSSLATTAATFYKDTHPYSASRRSYDQIYIDTLLLPGQDWHRNGKASERISHPNASGEGADKTWAAVKYIVSGNGVKKEGYYPELTLMAHHFTDEDGKTNMAFYDDEGKIVLERKIYNAAAKIFYDTYYVYDKKNLLRFVLSPEASNRMTSTSTVYTSQGTNTAGNPIDQYCFIYEYDNEKRCIRKKLPGADWTEYVYDKAGRLVLQQDANQRNQTEKEWSFTLYDKYGRTIQQGTVKSNKTRAAFQTEYDTKAATESWTSTGYTNTNTFGVAAAKRLVMQVNYYDTYEFLDIPQYSGIRNNLLYMASSGYGQKATRIVDGVDISTRGMLTGTETRLLDNTASTTQAFYYDDRGRMVQERSNNHLNGSGVTYNAYNFNNTLEKTNTFQRDPSCRYPGQVGYSYLYDRAGRHTSTMQYVMGTGNINYRIRIDSTRYNDLGQVSSRRLHQEAYPIGYTYNIRGQLTSINSSLFSQTISYQKGNAKKILQRQYSGHQ